jgi:uncharacterized low-complexity protein
MFKKIAAAAVLAGALAFSAAAPAVLSAGSVSHTSGVSEATGIWHDPASTKDMGNKSNEKTYTTYTGIWPDPA